MKRSLQGKLSKVFSLLLVLSILLGADLAPVMAVVGTQTISGTESYGNLRITLFDSGAIKLEQYINSWADYIFWDTDYLAPSSSVTVCVGTTKYDLFTEVTPWFHNGLASNEEYVQFISNTKVDNNTLVGIWDLKDPAGTHPVLATLKHTITYTNGNKYYTSKFEITNKTGSDKDIRLFRAEDTYLYGSDEATGWYDASIGKGSVGVTHPTNGMKMWLQAVSEEASSYYENLYIFVYEKLYAINCNDKVDLPNTVKSAKDDAGYALGFTKTGLANNGTWTLFLEEHLEPVPQPVVPTPAAEIPGTGFAPGVRTDLPAQSADKGYSTLGELHLSIPKLGVDTSILGVPRSGDSWDVSWLGDNAGYLAGSAFPTLVGNSVLTGHVWNADNKPGIFADLKSLSYGDRFTIKAYGVTYTYEVRKSMLVSSKDVRTMLQHKEDYSWVTLTTCEGWDARAKDYLQRRLVMAVLVAHD